MSILNLRISCHCGSSFGSLGSTSCKYKCSGNSNETCGDYSANSVYLLSKFEKYSGKCLEI